VMVGMRDSSLTSDDEPLPSTIDLHCYCHLQELQLRRRVASELN